MHHLTLQRLVFGDRARSGTCGSAVRIVMAEIL
jgi:hypothetical protein